MKSRKKKSVPVRAKRYKKKLATNFDYNNLEPRQLLAADFVGSSINFQGGSDLVQVKPVPLSEAADLLGERLGLGQNESIKLQRIDTDRIGMTHYKYEQYFNNILVEGSGYTLHTQDSQIVMMSGSRVGVQNPMQGGVDDFISEASALERAIDFMGIESYLGQEQGLPAPEGELVYLTDVGGQTVPTYKFGIGSKGGAANYAYVNANSGNVEVLEDAIYHANVPASGETLYNGVQDFTADDVSFYDPVTGELIGDPVFILNRNRLPEVPMMPGDPPDVVEVHTWDHQTNPDFLISVPIPNPLFTTEITSESSVFDNFTNLAEISGVSTHWAAEQTLEYYRTAHDRISYDNDPLIAPYGKPIYSFVNVNVDMVNAFWNPIFEYAAFGQGDGNITGPLTSLDIVGHELTHAVNQYTGNLANFNEPGALGESFSDIFGEAIENYAQGGFNDWEVGADIYLDLTSALRSFKDPNLYNQPDTYKGDMWFYGPGDNGGVHFNSGVMNKWFYILSEGEAGVNDNSETYDVVGIGIEDAAAIAYRNFTLFMGPNSQYQDARDGAVQAAIDLFGVDSQQHISTQRAWAAVGLYGPEVVILDMEPITPGSLIYSGHGEGTVEPDDTRVVLTEFDAGQSLSLIVQTQNGLRTGVEVQAPDGSIVGSVLGTSDTVTLEDVPIEQGGIYRILLSSLDFTDGAFDIELLLNASLEDEIFGSVGNDTFANAENIDGSGFDLSVPGQSQANRIAVAGEFSVVEAPRIYFEDFESGSLDAAWTTSSSDIFGRIQLTDQYGAGEGSFAMLMDQRATGIPNLNEAIWTVDLSAIDTPLLNFFHAEWNDENGTLPVVFQNSFNADGVSVSEDGVIWHTIMTDVETAAGEWNRFSINLQEIAETRGIALTSDFKIKFQQFDDGQIGSDGRGYDGIEIKKQIATTDDWYSFELVEGQASTIVASNYDGASEMVLELYDAAGVLIASGTDGADGVSDISRFVPTASGTYYAKLQSTGTGTKYSLVVTRGTDFDHGSTESSPQDINSTLSVLGRTGALTGRAADPDTSPDQSVVNNVYEGVTLSNAVTGGNVYALNTTYEAPTGNRIFAPTIASDAGWQEGENELRADFDVEQFVVAIDVGSDDGAADIGFLRGYDSDGNLIDESFSRSLDTGESQTIRVRSILGEIAYVIAGGVGNDIAPLDNLRYEIALDSIDYYTFDIVGGNTVGVQARFPGEERYLFTNRLVNPTGIQFRMELSDPAGTVVASGQDQIFFNSIDSGTYQLKVYTVAGDGDYLISIDNDVRNGIAVADDASGLAYLMYSAENLDTRFATNPPLAGTHENMIAVRFRNGAWQYNDDVAWHSFVPVNSDRLVAAIDLTDDTVRSLQGTSGLVNGIQKGFIDTDYVFEANQFRGMADPGEFTASGSFFETGDETFSIGNVGLGVAVGDQATGTGYLMFSEEDVNSRFSDSPPFTGNASHVIAVRHVANAGSEAFSYDVNVDNQDSGIVSDETFALGDVNSIDSVSIDIAHTFGGDLEIVLTAPDGTPYSLMFDEVDQTGSGNFDMGLAAGNPTLANVDTYTFVESGGSAVYDDSAGWVAGGVFNADGWGGGGHAAGDWTLVINDDAGGDGTSIGSVTINYTTSATSDWEYNNNQSWVPFVPVDSDRLLASVDFSKDTVDSLKGKSGQVFGIDQGFVNGDLTFRADRWNGSFNNGEFEVLGTNFVVPQNVGGVGDLGLGIAVADLASGTGFLMMSGENVFTRFSSSPPFVGSSDVLIAVRYDSGTASWQYNDNQNWQPFTPMAGDHLVASIDFNADRIFSLQGVTGSFNGISQGYVDSDFVFQANRWNGRHNFGEFTAYGSYFITGVEATHGTGNLRGGIAVGDNAGGTGFIMYSSEIVHNRFTTNTPYYDNSDHFIAVRYNSGLRTWQYNDNFSWRSFVMTEGDRLLASVNFTTDSITSLLGTNTSFQGIPMGFVDGDLSFFANQFGGIANSGEFEITGTFFTA